MDGTAALRKIEVEIEAELDDELQERARARGCTRDEVLREVLRRDLGTVTRNGNRSDEDWPPAPADDPLYQLLDEIDARPAPDEPLIDEDATDPFRQLIGAFASGRSDISERHDTYLYGSEITD